MTPPEPFQDGGSKQKNDMIGAGASEQAIRLKTLPNPEDLPEPFEGGGSNQKNEMAGASKQAILQKTQGLHGLSPHNLCLEPFQVRGDQKNGLAGASDQAQYP